ncbi:PREDICTED: uncharacterized protein LOC106543276 [Thamnophis sirtalis]|uniref:Uncharacterized protein LOC106543276 n=1 Tax=Thamnophis sirtalis TaxID=35019 RepID=A0A6I9XVQ9_9SAUR|nr:PREDICTED: uncharacterized protein LOC106543276 [Thamnophis sirtalis]
MATTTLPIDKMAAAVFLHPKQCPRGPKWQKELPPGYPHSKPAPEIPKCETSLPVATTLPGDCLWYPARYILNHKLLHSLKHLNKAREDQLNRSFSPADSDSTNKFKLKQKVTQQCLFMLSPTCSPLLQQLALAMDYLLFTQVEVYLAMEVNLPSPMESWGHLATKEESAGRGSSPDRQPTIHLMNFGATAWSRMYPHPTPEKSRDSTTAAANTAPCLATPRLAPLPLTGATTIPQGASLPSAPWGPLVLQPRRAAFRGGGLSTLTHS